mmetsp:Transcript_85763/g.223812  ORF Transcript_85763/g.223812 Transcript_85763/m.223812 type:complete len:364 (+) Transcript_85763:643-1734(+)
MGTAHPWPGREARAPKKSPTAPSVAAVRRPRAAAAPSMQRSPGRPVGHSAEHEPRVRLGEHEVVRQRLGLLPVLRDEGQPVVASLLLVAVGEDPLQLPHRGALVDVHFLVDPAEVQGDRQAEVADLQEPVLLGQHGVVLQRVLDHALLLPVVLRERGGRADAEVVDAPASDVGDRPLQLHDLCAPLEGVDRRSVALQLVVLVVRQQHHELHHGGVGRLQRRRRSGGLLVLQACVELQEVLGQGRVDRQRGDRLGLLARLRVRPEADLEGVRLLGVHVDQLRGPDLERQNGQPRAQLADGGLVPRPIGHDVELHCLWRHWDADLQGDPQLLALRDALQGRPEVPLEGLHRLAHVGVDPDQRQLD